MKNSHRWVVLHSLGMLLGYAMRIVAFSRRFEVALFLSAKLAFFFKFTTAYKEQRRYLMDGIEDISFAFLLNAMTSAETFFNYRVTVEGFEMLEDALKGKTGVLMVGVHGQLHPLIVRYLVDHSYSPVVVNINDTYQVAGTSKVIMAIPPTKSFLLTVRKYLNSRRLVMALVDRQSALGDRTVEYHTPDGPMYIATPIIHVARSSRARIVFFRIFIQEKKVLIKIGTPDTNSDDVNIITKDFIHFLSSTY